MFLRIPRILCFTEKKHFNLYRTVNSDRLFSRKESDNYVQRKTIENNEKSCIDGYLEVV